MNMTLWIFGFILLLTINILIYVSNEPFKDPKYKSWINSYLSLLITFIGVYAAVHINEYLLEEGDRQKSIKLLEVSKDELNTLLTDLDLAKSSYTFIEKKNTDAPQSFSDFVKQNPPRFPITFERLISSDFFIKNISHDSILEMSMAIRDLKKILDTNRLNSQNVESAIDVSKDQTKWIIALVDIELNFKKKKIRNEEIKALQHRTFERRMKNLPFGFN